MAPTVTPDSTFLWLVATVNVQTLLGVAVFFFLSVIDTVPARQWCPDGNRIGWSRNGLRLHCPIIWHRTCDLLPPTWQFPHRGLVQPLRWHLLSKNSSGIAPNDGRKSTSPLLPLQSARTLWRDVFVSGTICTLPVPAWYPFGMV